MTVSDDANDTQEESASVSVLIADDHPVMSTALRTYVDSSPGMRCIGEANNGEAAVSRALELRPDVVVMDLHMPGIGGIEATRRIRDEDPAISVLAVTTFSTERYVIPALRAGAGGYIVKDAEPEEILSAIRQVHEGIARFSPSVAQQLMVSVENSPAEVETALARFRVPPHLPERELEGLQLLAKGSSNAEIATQMSVSEATVKVYMGRLMNRLEVRDRVQLLIRSAQLGLVDPRLD